MCNVYDFRGKIEENESSLIEDEDSLQSKKKKGKKDRKKKGGESDDDDDDVDEITKDMLELPTKDSKAKLKVSYYLVTN